MNVRFAEGPVSDFVKNCVNVPRFLACCKECLNFDRRWSCPPYDFSVEELWKQYTEILLYEKKVYVNSGIRERVYSQEEINEISRELLTPAKKQMTEDLLAMEGKYPGSRALFAGTCDFCTICAKELNEKCFHPEKMRYSIEALGGNVSLAAKIYFDETVLWAKDGHLPKYYILIGGLLRP